MRPAPKVLFFEVCPPHGMAVVSMMESISTGVRVGLAESIKAITPDTQGAAIDVPLMLQYSELEVWLNDKMLLPGADMSGLIRPMLVGSPSVQG